VLQWIRGRRKFPRFGRGQRYQNGFDTRHTSPWSARNSFPVCVGGAAFHLSGLRRCLFRSRNGVAGGGWSVPRCAGRLKRMRFSLRSSSSAVCPSTFLVLPQLAFEFIRASAEPLLFGFHLVHRTGPAAISCCEISPSNPRQGVSASRSSSFALLANILGAAGRAICSRISAYRRAFEACRLSDASCFFPLLHRYR